MHDDPEAWRHSNMGRLLNNALVRFERRVLDQLAERGHPRVRRLHINLTRHLDVGGTTSTELARRAGMTKQAMAEIVEKCEQLGLVTRIPDPKDARAKIVIFTATGLAWLAAFKESIAVAEQEMREELGYLRVDAIASALQRYGRKLHSLRHDGVAGGAPADRAAEPDHLQDA